MPIYEYQCSECGSRVERLQKLGDPPPEACEACGGEMERQVSAPAFQFKGSGWYATDYAKPKPRAETGQSGGESEKSGEGSEKADAKAPANSGGASDSTSPSKSEPSAPAKPAAGAD